MKKEIANAAVESEAPPTSQPVPPAAATEPSLPAPPASEPSPQPAPMATPARVAGERKNSDAEILLAQLLDRQNKLSEDISEEGEAAYQSV